MALRIQIESIFTSKVPTAYTTEINIIEQLICCVMNTRVLSYQQ